MANKAETIVAGKETEKRSFVEVGICIPVMVNLFGNVVAALPNFFSLDDKEVAEEETEKVEVGEPFQEHEVVHKDEQN